MAESEGRPAVVTSPAPSPDELFSRLVQRVCDAGAFVSPKIRRSAQSPLTVPGIVASQPLRKPEEIIRIPTAVQLTLVAIQELGDELVEAVSAFTSENVRIECPEVVSFVAKRLHSLEARGPSCEDGQDGWHDATWLDLLLGMQLGADFRYMPHRRLIDDKNARRVLLPSPEVHNAEWNEAAYRDAHQTIIRHVSAEIRGPAFDLDRFVQSHLLLLTRTFGKTNASEKSTVHCCVPVADMFNHSTAPNATWEFDSNGDFVVVVTRSISPEEEVYISYGRDKSNVRLFRTYGFTVGPEVEPSWSFRVWPTLAREVYSQFLPERERRKVIDLEIRRVDETARIALQACQENGHEPVEFLRALCTHFRVKYEADEPLQVALNALRRARALDPSSSAWWRYGEEASVQAFCSAMSSDSTDRCTDRDFAQNALRVKMSEYLCIVAHIEAIDLISGTAQEESCLDRASELRRQLAKALRTARSADDILGQEAQAIPPSPSLSPGLLQCQGMAVSSNSEASVAA